MKKLPFLLLSLFLFQCSAGKLSTSHQTYNQDDYLYWSDTRKLSWDDFKGVPQGSSNDYTTQLFMSIPSSIDKTPFTAPTLTSTCIFDKRKSWVNKNVANDTLLLYCRTIFDIHEVYARKLRKTFMETNFGLNDFKEKYTDMTSKNNNDLMNRVEEFRRESFYGQKSKVVYHWASQIKNELQDLNQYKKDY
ncbi:MAG: hypothetical protein P4L35_17055 [Ignavibacteriaceae bacterium]|nr:hypothetical protein [Ignavibacteriaceae bacterium]